MVEFTPPGDDRTLDERRAHLAMSLHRYIAEIETILTDMADGNFGDAGQVPKLKREMMSVAKQLRDAEIECDQRQRAAAGLADQEFDIERARRDIGRRLDRLRAAQDAGVFSGEADPG